MKTRQILGLIYEKANSIDISGPLQVFDTASRLLRESKKVNGDAYCVQTIAATSQAVQLTGGLKALPHYTFDTMYDCTPTKKEPTTAPTIDTLIIPGGQGAYMAADHTPTTTWLSTAVSGTRRIASTCTGAFIMARAGLLHCRRATTHWQYAEQLQKEYPDIHVCSDAIFIKDDNIYSSAGVTSGIDLALALVEEDWGADIALAVAKQIVVFYRRSAGQSQYSPLLTLQAPQQSRIAVLQEWIINNLHEPLPLERIAEQVSLSPRHLARIFKRDTGSTVNEFIIRARLDAARSLLSSSTFSITHIAEKVGLGHSENMRRLFVQYLQTSPRQYRQHFSQTKSSHAT
ncbi:GlxA family transcriptional regulator [Eionea flava]